MILINWDRDFRYLLACLHTLADEEILEDGQFRYFLIMELWRSL